MIESVLLVLEDRTQFHGRATGTIGSAVEGVVSNTSATGYQEILTDSSYPHQIIILTYLHVGNVGTNDVDEESSQVHAQGLAIHGLSLIASNFRDTKDLSSYPKRHNIMVIAGTDTRKPTRLLHEEDAQNGCIITGDNPDAALVLKRVRVFPSLSGVDPAKEVTTAGLYSWTQRGWTLAGSLPETKKGDELPYHVVAYDFGTRRNILRVLVDRGCRLTIIPTQTSTEDVLKMDPDGISLSNGPGDPVPRDYAIITIQKFLETDTPVFGICLGYQLLALASDAKTIKTKFGHHGGNHPAKDAEKNVVMTTARSHGFTVDKTILLADLCVTHKSPFDDTLQGIRRTDKPAFSSQEHPEVSPGLHDAASLFDHFITLIERCRKIVK